MPRGVLWNARCVLRQGIRRFEIWAERTKQTDQLVLLQFCRSPKELYDVILQSPLASDLSDNGVEVLPGWSKHQMVLVIGATKATFSKVSMPWQVAVPVWYETDILAAVRTLRQRVRPKLKYRIVITNETYTAANTFASTAA